VVAIDPGRAKCGIAVVNRNRTTLFRSVALTTNIASEVARVIAVYRPIEIAVGNGTGSKHVIEIIGCVLSPSLPIRTIMEAYTSEEARKRYVKEVKPPWLQRFLPPSLRTPPTPYDDYVAVILGERYWRIICGEQ
jgi:RNase H-fold protein (predicted Holliday junction resolvase)